MSDSNRSPSSQAKYAAITPHPGYLPSLRFVVFVATKGFLGTGVAMTGASCYLLSKMDAEKIGLSAMKLGAGRETKDSEIDYTAGIRLIKKTGDYVKCGDTLAYFYTNNESAISDAEELFFSSITYSDTKPEKAPLIYKIITHGV